MPNVNSAALLVVDAQGLSRRPIRTGIEQDLRKLSRERLVVTGVSTKCSQWAAFGPQFRRK